MFIIYILVVLGMYLHDMVAEAVLTSLLVRGAEKELLLTNIRGMSARIAHHCRLLAAAFRHIVLRKV